MTLSQRQIYRFKVLAVQNLAAVRNQQLLFSAVNFTLSPGEILHISGVNGCGKSTLLHILVGLLWPEQGEVQWQNVPIRETLSQYQSQLVFIGHKIGVKASLTVLENLRLAAQLGTSTSSLDWSQILQRFQLSDLQHMSCNQLSAGQRQRVALARLLIVDAVLWVLDEPFTAIDSESITLLQQLLQEHAQRGGMVALTSHQPFELPGVKRLQLDRQCSP